MFDNYRKAKIWLDRHDLLNSANDTSNHSNNLKIIL